MKHQFVIRIADLNVEMNCLYDYTFSLCKDYIVDSKDIDIVTVVDEVKIEEYSKITNDKGVGESLCLYEQISSKLSDFNKILIHAAAIEYNGNAYLFLARSGVGKSTHIGMLKDNFVGINIINGDKPIIDDKGFVYGTPWAGKEKWNSNTKAKIKGIILINRDNYNHIEKVDKSDYLTEILNQIYRKSNYEINLEIIDKAFKDVDVYQMGCLNNIDAAKLSFNEILNKILNNETK